MTNYGEGIRPRDWDSMESIDYLPKIKGINFPPTSTLSPEEQKEISSITEDLNHIGVVSEFQRIIEEGTILMINNENNSRPHIEYGESTELGKGLFLVFENKTDFRQVYPGITTYYMLPHNGKEVTTSQKKAIGVTKINGKYNIGYYSKSIGDTHLLAAFRRKTYTQWSPERRGNQGLIEKGKVIETLRTVVGSFKHDQEETRDN